MSNVKNVVEEVTYCNTTTGYNAIDVFNIPRAEGEDDLVSMISIELSSLYHPTSSLMFLNNPEINLVKDLNPFSQRVIINRWFNCELLKYRDDFEDPNVNKVLGLVIIDGDVDMWLECLQTIVIPFFKLNNILKIEMEINNG